MASDPNDGASHHSTPLIDALLDRAQESTRRSRQAGVVLISPTIPFAAAAVTELLCRSPILFSLPRLPPVVQLLFLSGMGGPMLVLLCSPLAKRSFALLGTRRTFVALSAIVAAHAIWRLALVVAGLNGTDLPASVPGWARNLILVLVGVSPTVVNGVFIWIAASIFLTTADDKVATPPTSKISG